MKPQMFRIGRQTKAAALACALVALPGCDKLLEVDLPDAVTAEDLDDPAFAAILVNSVMASVECAYSSMAMDAAGMEDNFQMVTGVAGNYSQYDDTPSGSPANDLCDSGVYTQNWVNPMLTARGQGYQTYNSILGWTVPDKSKLLATLGLYNAVSLGVFGEFFCEFAISSIDPATGIVTFGTKLTPNQTLAIAAQWVDTVLAYVPGVDSIRTTNGTVTRDMRQTAVGLRARLRYASGDLAGAAADAAAVTNGHMAWILREDGEDRRNMVSSMHGNGGGVTAAGFLQGPVRLKTASNAYGISALGTHPVTTVAWPDPVPFTGYINLAIYTADGRAVEDNGSPVTTATAATSADTRVQHALGATAGGIDNVIRKYTALSSDIPLLNWKEMRLILAENAGASSAGVDFVNQIRTADGLPLVQGAYRTLVEGSAARFDDLVIEERRRALWLEARFWSTKIIKNEKLWFPRGLGQWVNANASYQLLGGVRLLMPEDEYQINQNLTLADRATGCPAGQAPIYN
jgi:hypothetical protein